MFSPIDAVLEFLADEDTKRARAEARGLPECTPACPLCECPEDGDIRELCAHCRMH